MNFRTEGFARSSSPRDLEAIRQSFYRYDYDWSPVYFTDHIWEPVSPAEAHCSAKGPFAAYHLVHVEAFRNMAAAAPGAYMEATIVDLYPYDSYVCTKEKLHCRLENGILTTEISTVTRNSEDYPYEDYIVEVLPYEQYTEIFRIEPDSLAEKDYGEFISRLTGRCWESPLDLTFEEFSEVLSRFGGRTALDRETYETACEKAKAAGLITLAEFMDRISATETEVYRFDAASRQDLP